MKADSAVVTVVEAGREEAGVAHHEEDEHQEGDEAAGSQAQKADRKS